LIGEESKVQMRAKKLKMVLTAFALIAASALVVYFSIQYRIKAEWDELQSLAYKISIGMAESDVQTIMGGLPNTISHPHDQPGRFAQTWFKEYHEFVVEFENSMSKNLHIERLDWPELPNWLLRLMNYSSTPSYTCPG
jgi:hypothetical protein